MNRRADSATEMQNPSSDIPPNLHDFLTGPIEQVQAVAPASMVYAPGGTRRSAVFHGITPWTEAYFEWGFTQTLKCIRVLFEHGVQHVFLPLYMSGHIREYDGATQHLMQLVLEYITNDMRLAEYRSNGWRVRLVNIGGAAILEDAAQRVSEATAANDGPVLWMMTSENAALQWQLILAAAKDPTVATQADAIRALYGEPIPPISLYLGFGKPMVNAELFPPLLVDEIQCYWSQQAGYGLDAQQFRRIVYDFAYVRPTWQQDKTRRAATAANEQALWQSEYILGVGQRLGSFWYPSIQHYPSDQVSGRETTS